MLTALLDAHSDVTMYYEPWNASPNRRPEPPETLDGFCKLMRERFGAGDRETPFVGFKETATYDASRDFAVETIDNVSRETPTEVLWIYRDPVHCFFSKLEGARKWWGRPEACFSKDGLVQYLRESGPHLSAMLDVTERHGGTIVAYDGLASRPEPTLRVLMGIFGLSLEPSQFDYYKAGPNPGRVMGDPNVAESPSPLTPSSIARRRAEVEQNHEVIESVCSAPEFDWLRKECERLSSLSDVTSLCQGR